MTDCEQHIMLLIVDLGSFYHRIFGCFLLISFFFFFFSFLFLSTCPGNLTLLVNHFLDLFHAASPHRKQAVLILNEIVLGTLETGLSDSTVASWDAGKETTVDDKQLNDSDEIKNMIRLVLKAHFVIHNFILPFFLSFFLSFSFSLIILLTSKHLKSKKVQSIVSKCFFE